MESALDRAAEEILKLRTLLTMPVLTESSLPDLLAELERRGWEQCRILWSTDLHRYRVSITEPAVPLVERVVDGGNG
jgi:hypothetical protein